MKNAKTTSGSRKFRQIDDLWQESLYRISAHPKDAGVHYMEAAIWQKECISRKEIKELWNKAYRKVKVAQQRF